MAAVAALALDGQGVLLLCFPGILLLSLNGFAKCQLQQLSFFEILFYFIIRYYFEIISHFLNFFFMFFVFFISIRHNYQEAKLDETIQKTLDKAIKKGVDGKSLKISSDFLGNYCCYSPQKEIFSIPTFQHMVVR